MRHVLVLGDETARHPFRQSLPPHLRRGTVKTREAKPARRGWWAALAGSRQRDWKNATDWRAFLITYTASFAAALVFFV